MLWKVFRRGYPTPCMHRNHFLILNGGFLAPNICSRENIYRPQPIDFFRWTKLLCADYVLPFARQKYDPFVKRSVAKKKTKQRTACLFQLLQISQTALSRRLFLFKIIKPTLQPDWGLQTVNISLAVFQHLALSKQPGLHPKKIVMLIIL